MLISAKDFLPIAVKFENSIPHMYLDTSGVVTVGIGIALETADEAAGLPFADARGRAVAPVDIAAAWAKVKAAPKKKKAAFYKSFTDIVLPEPEIERLALGTIGTILRSLVRRVPWLTDLPKPAQIAMMDMAYNLGAAGLTREWPRLMAACEARDFETASIECRRSQVNEERNAHTADLFAQAADEIGAVPLKPTALIAAEPVSIAPPPVKVTQEAVANPQGEAVRPAGFWSWLKSKRLWLGGVPLGLGGGADLGIDALWDKAVDWFGDDPDRISTLLDHAGKLEFLKSRAALILIALGLAGLILTYYLDRRKRP